MGVGEFICSLNSCHRKQFLFSFHFNDRVKSSVAVPNIGLKGPKKIGGLFSSSRELDGLVSGVKPSSSKIAKVFLVVSTLAHGCLKHI